MNFPSILLITVLVTMCASSAQAEVSAAEAAQLGNALTLFGAEKAGNRDGTIPPYTGGLPVDISPPGFVKGSGRWTTPFPDEKPLYSITAQNINKYADLLTETNKALFKRDSNYRIDVYPSHRTVNFPAWVLDNTVKNATNAHLIKDGLAVEGAFGGIPFPIPKNGNEVIWNHVLRFAGSIADFRLRNWYVDKSGRAVNSGEMHFSYYSYYYSPTWTIEDFKKNNSIVVEYAWNFLGPPQAVGNATLIRENLDPDAHPRRAHTYSAFSRRIRLNPDLFYDTPIASTGGVITYDEVNLFEGPMDRFDYKLLGKREMLIPYNNHTLVYQTKSSQILIPKHLNPDFVRWELHRVRVVEATLKPGKRHVTSRRVYYLDEDYTGAGGFDGYDSRGKLTKGLFYTNHPLYDIQIPLSNFSWAYDFSSQTYAVSSHYGDPGLYWSPKIDGFSPMMLTPDGLPNRGGR